VSQVSTSESDTAIVSPFQGALISEPIIEITAAAHEKLIELRSDETEPDKFGLRLEIISQPGEEFRYDLSFDEFLKAAFTDEVRNLGGLRVIVPGKDVESLTGATLDYADSTGLVLRNPNKPQMDRPEGLIFDDVISAEVETVISTEVNPSLAAHGGFVTYVGHDDQGTAYLTMGGGCHGCSMSRLTMLDGVQTMLIEKVPQIERVKDITDHSSGENPYYS
jgi:Fe/S biogenesis protein NfuA